VKPKKNPEVNWRLEEGLYQIAVDKLRKGEEFEDMAVLSIMCGQEIKQLNLVGAEVWQRVNGIHRMERIVESVAEFFGLPPESMKDGIEGFIKSMEEKGWISYE
jgi:GeoRSP system PqqD family protein